MLVIGSEGRRARLLCSTGLIVAGLAMGVPSYAMAADQAPEIVVVTGSRIAQSGFDASSPVTVLGAEQIKLSGTVNVETLLNQTPQFVASTNGGPMSNVVPGGQAYLNLRGLGQVRNLVLVNGRRYTIQGTDLTTDINTIPVALIERTEIVTGGSSAVYGSDAIAGVVNFIMRQNFQGVEADGHVNFDSMTSTPTYSTDLTIGSNFDNDRGNVAVSLNYMRRGSIARSQVPYAVPALGDGCVTPGTYRSDGPGTPVAGNPTGQNCLNAGGVMGLVAGGSGDIPNGRFTPTSSTLAPGGANASLNAAYAAAGLSGIGSFGWTYDDAGATARPALDPQDRYNLSLPNYLQVPQERWMVNTFAHYDLFPNVTGYVEFHFSNNSVTALLAPSNSNGTFLYNTNNPYLSPAMQNLFAQYDAAQTGTICSSLNSAVCSTQNDGIAAVASGRRFTDVGPRINDSERVAWRFAGGFKGVLGDMSENFMKDLSYDIYYMYARTNETDHQNGAISKSHLQAALLSVGGAPPVCNIFGQNITSACVSAIGIASTNITKAELAGAAGTLTGTAFDLPAGPVQFVLGAEWRFTKAVYSPDQFVATGDVAGFNGSKPTAGDESVKEEFGEIRIPLLSDLPLVEKLTANGAFRYSDYDLTGVGKVWTYSYGGDWRVTDDINFRGQFQHAIRAPNVGELYGGQATIFSTVNDPCSNRPASNLQTTAVRTVCEGTGVNSADVFTGGIQPNTVIQNSSGGNPLLSAEASNTVTFGTVITPTFIPNLAVSVDYYRINVVGAIAPLSGGISGILNNCYYTLQNAGSVYCQAITRDPGTGQITNVNAGLANAGALKTSGIDFEGQYNFDVDWGVFADESNVAITTDWTHEHEFTLTPIKDQPNVKNECVGSYGPTCGEPNPEWKGVTRVTWHDGPFSLSLRHRYIDSVTIDKYLLPKRSGGAVPALATLTNPILPSFNYLDVSVGYDWSDNVELSGGVNNVFDKSPPIVGSSAGYGNTWPATYDALGQMFFIDVSLKTN